jgi:hypothetical protein
MKSEIQNPPRRQDQKNKEKDKVWKQKEIGGEIPPPIILTTQPPVFSHRQPHGRAEMCFHKLLTLRKELGGTKGTEGAGPLSSLLSRANTRLKRERKLLGQRSVPNFR